MTLPGWPFGFGFRSPDHLAAYLEPAYLVHVVLSSKRGLSLEKVKSKPGLLNFYKASTKEIREYFKHLTALIEAFPLDVALAYVFSRVELAHNMALYCGIAKLHKADTTLPSALFRGFTLLAKDFGKSTKSFTASRSPTKSLA